MIIVMCDSFVNVVNGLKYVKDDSISMGKSYYDEDKSEIHLSPYDFDEMVKEIREFNPDFLKNK